MRLHVGEIDVEAFKSEIGEHIQLLRARNRFLPDHHQKRNAKRREPFQEGSLFAKAAEGRAGGAMISVEMDLDRKRTRSDGRRRKVEIVTGKRDDDREFALAQRPGKSGFRIGRHEKPQFRRKPPSAAKRWILESSGR